MQTFLPHPAFATSARLLDDRRLGKQRVEAFQILRALTWPTYAWKNHPAVAMWRGFVPALVSYAVAACEEWVRRGFADGVREQVLPFAGGVAPGRAALRDQGLLPPWLGREDVHRSHRAALVRKDPGHYRPLFPDVDGDLPYVWPAPAFPRWPVRRPHPGPLDLPEALELLGLAAARPGQRRAVDDVRAGHDHAVRLPPGGGATTAGLLCGLCRPGRVAWVVPGAAPAAGELPPAADDPVATVPRPVAAGAGRRPAVRAAPSTARAPGPHDLAATQAEATADAQFRYFHAGQDPAPAALDGVGLVVLDGVPTDVALLRDPRLAGVPRLTLVRGG